MPPRKNQNDPPFKSYFERDVWYVNNLSAKPKVLYEPMKVPYTIQATYTPDLVMPNGLVVELKGLLTVEDRRKLISVKQQYPEVNIALLFQNCDTRLTPRAKTTYAEWAIKNGFMFANGVRIPEPWLNPRIKPDSLYKQWLDNPYRWT